MQKRFVKRFSLILSLLLVLALSSWAGAAQVVEITSWDLPTNDMRGKILGLIQAEFDKTHPNIKVVRKALPQHTEGDRAAFMTAMAGGNGPDCYHFVHFPTMESWVTKGYVASLDKYVKKWPDIKSFVPVAIKQCQINGHWYGIPSFASLYTMTWVYRKDLFQAANLDPKKPPKNWGELASMAQKLTVPEKNQYGMVLLGQEWADWWFEYYVWQAGGDLTSKLKDGSVKLRFTEKPVVTALKFYKDLRWKYKCVQKNVLQDVDANGIDFSTGKAAMTIMASDWASKWELFGLDRSKVGYSPMPVGPAGKPYISVGGDYYIINPTIKKQKQDAAWTYISWMAGRKTYIKRLKLLAENGVDIPEVCPFKDIDTTDYMPKIDPQWAQALAIGLANGKPEYFLKERLTPYVVKAVQRILTDEKADPFTELKAAQELAQKEVVDKYNADLKK